MTPAEVLVAMGGAHDVTLPVSPYPRTPAERAARRRIVVRRAGDAGDLTDGAVVAHRRLRRAAFVEAQGLFRDDLDAHDEDPRTVVLVAIDVGHDGRRADVVGGVRVHPALAGERDVGWWRGSRLVARRGDGVRSGLVGARLVEEACRVATAEGALRFDATVQEHCAGFFVRLGWERRHDVVAHGIPHVEFRWPIERVQALVEATKLPLGGLLTGVAAEADAAMGGVLGPWIGDDGVPFAVPGADAGVVACVDAILPAMVDADPEWAGWCGALVTAHDLSAMGARPLAALDALGARDTAHAEAVLRGLRDGAQRLGLPIAGGHTTLGVAPSLAVTGLGLAVDPVPAGGGRPGDDLHLLADLAGGWRPGSGRRQWDSSTGRSREELGAMLAAVPDARPAAAKDVSMAGILGTVGMLAEASGCGAEIDAAAVPRPGGATAGDWLTCFPGFAMVCAERPGRPSPPAGPATSSTCGRLTSASGVVVRWPDGETTTVVDGPATGLGVARDRPGPVARDPRPGSRPAVARHDHAPRSRRTP